VSQARTFKDGLLIGNWFSSVAQVRYSKELQRYWSFYGPWAVRFGNLQIAG
jgi:hypothetical protein